MKKYIIAIIILACSVSAKAQFSNTDTLRAFINRWIRNSAVEAFQNLRLNTALIGMTNFLDSAYGNQVRNFEAVNDTTARLVTIGYDTFTVHLRGNGITALRRRAGTDTVEFLKNSGGWQFAFIDSTGGGGATLANIGSGYRWVATPGGDIKTVANSNTITWDSTSNANSLTGKVDTTVVSTKYYVDNKQEQLLGVIYNANSWADASDFTTANVTANIVSNKIEVTPTSDGTYTAILSYTPPTSLEYYKIALKYKINAITATSYGVGLGLSSINAYSAPSNLATVNFLTGSTTNRPVRLQCDNGTGTFTDVTQSAGGISASVNDYILVTWERNGTEVTCIAQNLTTNSSQIIAKHTFVIGPTPYLNNTARFSIYAIGGGFTIDSFAVTSTEVTRASVMFIGDSKTVGAVEYNTFSNRFANLVGKHFKSFCVEAGGGDRTVEVLARIDEILALRPKIAVLCIGSNDKRSGRSDGDFQTDYTAISTALTNAGIDVYYCLPFYETGVDLTSQRTWILATFPANKIIDGWTPMTIPGSLYSDNVHPTDSGHVRIADAILQKFNIREGKVNSDMVGTDDYLPIFRNNTLFNSFAHQTGAGSTASTIFDASIVSKGTGAGLTLFSRDGVDKYALYSPTASGGFSIYDKAASVDRMTIGGTTGNFNFNNVVTFGSNLTSITTPITIGNYGSAPLLIWKNGASGTDQAVWNWTADANQFVLQMLNDGVTLGTNLMMFKDRTSYTAANCYLPISDLVIGSSTDAGAYTLQNTGNTLLTGNATITGNATVADDAYDATGWNGSTQVPTKNAIRDKIESMSSGITSVNSMTGPAITITAGNAITTSSASNDVTIAVDVNNNSLPHTIDKQFIDANNTGTGETDLYTKAISGGTLGSNGQSFSFEIAGVFNDATATANLQLYFAGTSFAGTGAMTLTGTGSWRAQGSVIRVSSSVYRANVTFIVDNTSEKTFTSTANVTSVDFTTSNTFKITGTAGGGGGGSNDITAQMWQVLYWP